MKKIAIIGDGIMSWTFIDALLSSKDIDITVFHSKDAFPACSLNSTSINCLRGTKKGLSKLGDDIVDAFLLFEEFVSRHNPKGIEKGIEYQLFNDRIKWERRYSDFNNTSELKALNKVKNYSFVKANDAYFINPEKLKLWFEEKNQVKKVETLVHKIRTNGHVITQNKEYRFDEIFIFSNYATKNLIYGLKEEFDYYLDHCKPVAGSFLEIDLLETNLSFDSSFNFALDQHHFIYRKEQGVLQIGSTTDNKCDSHLPNEKELKTIYTHIQKHLDVTLPKFENFKKKVGVRHKGHKRMPYVGKISDKIYTCCGLYKNGYVLPFLYSKKLVEML